MKQLILERDGYSIILHFLGEIKSEFYTYTKTENKTLKVEDLAEEIYGFLDSVDDETRYDCEKALVLLNKQAHAEDTLYAHDLMSTEEGNYVWNLLDVVFTILMDNDFTLAYKQLRDSGDVEWHRFLLEAVKIAFIRDLKDRIGRIELAGE